MKIDVLGTGCAKCKKLFETAQKAVEEAGVEAEVNKVEDLDDIMDYGVMLTPAIAIDGKVLACGKVSKQAQIVKWIQAAAAK